MTSFQSVIPHVTEDAVTEFRAHSLGSIKAVSDDEDSKATSRQSGAPSDTRTTSRQSGALSFNRALDLLVNAHQAEVQMAREGHSHHKRWASHQNTKHRSQLKPISNSKRSTSKVAPVEAEVADVGEGISSSEGALESSPIVPLGLSDPEIRWHNMVNAVLEGLTGQKWAVNEVWKESEMVVRMVQIKDPYVDVWLTSTESIKKEKIKEKANLARLSVGQLLAGSTKDLNKAAMGPLAQSVHAFLSLSWCPRSWSELESRIVMKPQSNTRIAWSCVGIFLMLYDLIVLPLQFFNLPEGGFVQGVAMFAQVFWTMDMALSFVTGVYKDSRLITRLHVIARYYLSSWFLFDAIVIFPMWFLILAGGNGGFLESIRGIRYVRMVRFLRLLRLAKFNYLLQEALAAINSQVLLVTLGIVKLMIWMCLLSHVNACLWYAVGNSHPDGWASSYQEKSLFYKYVVSCHWALTQFQGTSEIVPGDSVGERCYAVVTVLLSLLIFATFVSLLTNNMMQLHKLGAEKNQNLRAVIMFLNRNAISSSLSMRVKQFVAARQKMQANSTGHDIVIQILNADLMSELHNEIRAPALDFHIFFQAFRGVYPRLVQKICHEVLYTVAPTPGELLFVSQERGFTMYFVTGGELTYTVTQRTEGELVTVASHILKRGEYLGEPAIWTTWQYRGHSVAEQFASTLAMDAQSFAEHVVTHPQAKVSCFMYARRYVKALAKVSNLGVNDLLNPFLFIPADDVMREWGVGANGNHELGRSSKATRNTANLRLDHSVSAISGISAFSTVSAKGEEKTIPSKMNSYGALK